MSVTVNDNRRRANRQALVYYLKVINLDTGKELGRVADITSAGMMLVGHTVLKKKTYRVRIIMETTINNMPLEDLDVSVQVRWSKPDVNPELTLTGILFLDLSDTGRKIIGNLIKTIGMNGRLDLTEEDIDSGVFDDEDFF